MFKATEEKKVNDEKEKNTGEEVRRRSLEFFAEIRKRNPEENLHNEAKICDFLCLLGVS